MNHEQAFLQAITEHPDDDTPRLVYADWLEEQGDLASRARAEFIRVQFALRDLSPDDPLRVQMEERERDLRIANESVWLAPLTGQCRVEGCLFRRGFVEKVSVRMAHLLEDGDTLFRLAPVNEVAFLRFPYSEKESIRSVVAQRLASSPYLQRLAAVDFTHYFDQAPGENPLRYLFSSQHWVRLTTLRVNAVDLFGPALKAWLKASFLSELTDLGLSGHVSERMGIDQLLGFPRLANLDRLDLTGLQLFPDELRVIANATHLNRLRTLRLISTQLWQAGMRPLVEASGLPALTALDLGNNALGTESIRQLARSELLGRLEALSLNMNYLSDEAAKALAESRQTGRLTRLNLNTTRISADGVSALARSPYLDSLTSLHLRTNRLGDAGLRALAGTTGLPRLAVLRVGYNGIGPEGVRALAEAPPGRLTILDLSWNPLTDAAVRALSASPLLEQLAALDLSYAQLGDEAALALAASPYLNNLHTLNLGTNRITDAGVIALARSTELPRLTALNLGYNAVSEVGVRALADSPRFASLTALNLAGNRIDPARLNELRREFRGHLGG